MKTPLSKLFNANDQQQQLPQLPCSMLHKLIQSRSLLGQQGFRKSPFSTSVGNTCVLQQNATKRVANTSRYSTTHQPHKHVSGKRARILFGEVFSENTKEDNILHIKWKKVTTEKKRNFLVLNGTGLTQENVRLYVIQDN
jgi:hypothetical protein